MGRQVETIELTEEFGLYVLKVKNFSQGIYLIGMKDDKSLVISKKLIIAR